MRISSWCWGNRCSSWCGSRSSRTGAGRATSGWASVASDAVTTLLVAEQLAKQTAVTLLASATAIASGSCTRIVASDFCTAGWSCVARTTGSDFSTTVRTNRTSARSFSAAAWSTRIAAAIIASAISMGMQAILESNQLALQALELVKNRSANANRSSARICTGYFSAAAWSCIARTAGSDLCTARRT